MSSNKRRKTEKTIKKNEGGLLERISNLSIDEMTSLQKTVPELLKAKLDIALRSEDPEEIMKANLFLENASKSANKDLKAVFFNPQDFSSSGRGYKVQQSGVAFSTLQRMGEIFIIKAIVNTRVEQVQNFLKFSVDEQKEGYTIRKKRSLFNKEKSKELSSQDEKKIEEIVDFLENGGNNDKWEAHDTFQDFVRMIVRDSLTLDQVSFELVRNRGFELEKYRAIDASMIRLLDSADPKLAEEFEKFRFKGYLPRYAMVYDGQILRNPTSGELVLYYPWELGYGIRNKTTNIYKNGYGVSELETLIEIITWILWGLQYNGNFFKQGSQPKGFINIKGGTADNETMSEFRQAWRQTMSGVENSHKTPAFSGIDLEWIDLQKNNRDMEFNEWVKFLFILACAVYRIDPSELGFSFKDQAQVFGQDGQKERLDHSKKKGLTPLLIFIEKLITKYIVSELDEDFEFVFTGIEVEDEEAQVKLDSDKIDKGFVSLEDMFRKYSGRDFDPQKDTILNQFYQSAAQAKMYGGEGMNEIAEGEGQQAAENPFEKYEKSFSSNPILGSAMEYINKMFENGETEG